MIHEMDLATALGAVQEQYSLLSQKNLNLPQTRYAHPIQFRQERDIASDQGQTKTLTERRIRETAIYNYIATQHTNFFSKDPNQRQTETRLLKHYIELYAHNPNTYPVDPQNKTHCLIRKAGEAVLNLELENRLRALKSEDTARQNHHLPSPLKKINK